MSWKIFDDSYDVVVVGGGPAGSMTAKTLAEKGVKVVVFEKRPEIGAPKRCGEGLSSRGLDELGIEIPEKCIMNRIRGAYLFAPNGKSFELTSKDGGFVLERKVFDKWLASEAAKAGAKVVAKTYVVDVLKDGDQVCGVVVEHMGEKREVNAKVVVAADGVESLTARRAGFSMKNSPSLFDSGFQYEMAGLDIKDPTMLELYLSKKIAPRGYVWIFPKSKTTANVGIGVIGTEEQKAKDLLDTFINGRPDLSKGSIIEVNAGGVPVGGLMKNMVADGLVLVGDAAHQVIPSHGGGIAQALIAGQIAGNVIAKAIEKNDYSEKTLSEYNKLWWKKEGNKLKRIELARQVFERLSDDDMNALADVLKPEDIMALTHGQRTLRLTKILAKYGWKRLRGNI